MFDSAQLAYMQDVLGLTSILVPEQVVAEGFQPAIVTPSLTVRTRGILSEARLIAVWARARAATSAEAEILAEKMVSAMKVQPGQVFWIDWEQGEGELPSEIFEVLGSSAPLPILVFGESTAAKLIPLQVAAGRWTDYRGGRYMITLSPEALLESTEKKRIAWSHLQIVMKEL